MSFQGPTWRVGATVFHVAPVSRSVSSTVMSRMQAVPSAMHSSQVPEVTSRRYSLPTCTMRVRIRVLSASSAPYRATAAAALAPSSWGLACVVGTSLSGCECLRRVRCLFWELVVVLRRSIVVMLRLWCWIRGLRSRLWPEIEGWVNRWWAGGSNSSASGVKPCVRVVLIHARWKLRSRHCAGGCASWRRRGSSWEKPAPSSPPRTKTPAL